MNRTTIMLASLFILAGIHANAQSVAPATSEDSQQFDKQVSQGAVDSDNDGDKDAGLAKGKNHKKKDNFGQKVSAEAEKLKDSDVAKRKEFGKWVSGQRRQDDQSSSNGSQGGSSGAGRSSDDARSSAPTTGASGSHRP